MSISEKDWKFMEEVASYFRSTKDKDNPEGSIRDTAIHFDLSRNKVRKILITTGDIKNELTEEAEKMRREGMSVEAIAERLGVSTATVSIYLPYMDTIKDALEPTPHAQAVRDYRAYQQMRAKNQVQKKNMEGDTGMADTSWKDEWIKEKKLSYTVTDTRPERTTWDDADELRDMIGDPEVLRLFGEAQRVMTQQTADDESELAALRGKSELTEEERTRLTALEREYGLFPGSLGHRRAKELEAVSGERIPFEPREVLRLHLELTDWLSDEKKDVLRTHGGVKYGDNISRDVVVPADIPLYAVHYLIQRLFGWQNSHLHKFELPEEKLKMITDNRVGMWAQYVGIIFRSPYMSEEDEFWADDYESGSFKNWLTRKYTGPYLSQCHGEGYVSCIHDMQAMFKDVLQKRLYYILYVKYSEEDVRIVSMTPVYDADGKMNPEPTAEWLPHGEKWVETVEFGDAPVMGLKGSHERGCFDLIERLPVNCILTSDPEEITGENMLDRIGGYIQRVIDAKVDSPNVQVYPEAFTDRLYYHYDFGDSWVVKITVSDDCEDLVAQGRITQEQLDKANIKCRELYRPVTLAVDGEMVMDDVGGVTGFVDFLRTINPDLTGMSAAEKEMAKAEKKETLEWAKNVQSWKKLNPMI